MEDALQAPRCPSKQFRRQKWPPKSHTEMGSAWSPAGVLLTIPEKRSNGSAPVAATPAQNRR